MVEPRKEGSGEAAASSAVPEGAEGISAGAALRQGLQAFRGSAQPSPDIGLDMLVELDEPELLVKRLHKLAAARGPGKWALVASYLVYVEDAFKVFNEPATKE